MNDDEFEQVVKAVVHHALELLKPKGQDYGGKDRLRNFKNVSHVWSILTGKTMTPTEAALFLEILKLDRYMNLYGKRAAAKNESITDTASDGVNYWSLMEACRRDENA